LKSLIFEALGLEKLKPKVAQLSSAQALCLLARSITIIKTNPTEAVRSLLG
jgi:hypothetical protein